MGAGWDASDFGGFRHAGLLRKVRKMKGRDQARGIGSDRIRLKCHEKEEWIVVFYDSMFWGALLKLLI